VDWWFVFKFSAGSFPGCAGGAQRACRFGGVAQSYKSGQQFAFASSERPALQMGNGCAGDTVGDPIGATFDQVYNGSFYYAIWNDQFYGDPMNAQGSPWGSSKGMLAWNEAGEGFVMQVSTPSWPGSGSPRAPRKTDGNTLGCVKDDNVLTSQHFFALRLSKADLIAVLNALENASVVIDPRNPQIVRNGGPVDVKVLVAALGSQSKSASATNVRLSSGARLISKPSRLNVPSWQMVSALLGGVPLRAATWWIAPCIWTTTASTPIACWDKSLGKPGAVEIAASGQWAGKRLELSGGAGPSFNHAKIGVSIGGSDRYSIFGDLNQQGDISGSNCRSSQNGRGGLFYVLNDPELFDSLKQLISGETAPDRAPR
jgi:hypothetical protein